MCAKSPNKYKYWEEYAMKKAIPPNSKNVPMVLNFKNLTTNAAIINIIAAISKPTDTIAFIKFPSLFAS